MEFSLRASTAIYVFFETLTLVREEQPMKANLSISLTDGGMLMLVSERQPEKVHSPISVTFVENYIIPVVSSGE